MADIFNHLFILIYYIRIALSKWRHRAKAKSFYIHCYGLLRNTVCHWNHWKGCASCDYFYLQVYLHSIEASTIHKRSIMSLFPRVVIIHVFSQNVSVIHVIRLFIRLSILYRSLPPSSGVSRLNRMMFFIVLFRLLWKKRYVKILFAQIRILLLFSNLIFSAHSMSFKHL